MLLVVSRGNEKERGASTAEQLANVVVGLFLEKREC